MGSPSEAVKGYDRASQDREDQLRARESLRAQSYLAGPSVPRTVLHNPNQLSPCITGVLPLDQGTEELEVAIEVWTVNHLDSQGNPCDGCPQCIGSEGTAQTRLLKDRAQEYQTWEKREIQERARLAQETTKKQNQKERALLPIQQELEVQKRGRERELRRIKRVYQQQKEEAETAYQGAVEVAQYRKDQALQTAKYQLKEDAEEIQKQYLETLEEIQQRLTQTAEEHQRTFESFQIAVDAEQRVLEQKVHQTYQNFHQLRDYLQTTCPHPSSEPLSITLARWPQKNGTPVPGYLRCRVCHKAFDYQTLALNVQRGATNLSYAPTPLIRRGEGPSGTGRAGSTAEHPGPRERRGGPEHGREDGEAPGSPRSGGGTGTEDSGGPLKRARTEGGSYPSEGTHLCPPDSPREGVPDGQGSQH